MWTLTRDGKYTAASAYVAQIEVAPNSIMMPVVWKKRIPPNAVFSVVDSSKRVWTTDRLGRQGWPKCELCQLCKREPETTAHLMSECRYPFRFWNGTKEWLVWWTLTLLNGATTPPWKLGGARPTGLMAGAGKGLRLYLCSLLQKFGMSGKYRFLEMWLPCLPI